LARERGVWDEAWGLLYRGEHGRLVRIRGWCRLHREDGQREGGHLRHVAFGVFDLARANWRRLPTGVVQATPGAKWGQGGEGSRTGVACLLLDHAARTLILLCCVHLCLCVACAGVSRCLVSLCVSLLLPSHCSLLPHLAPPSPSCACLVSCCPLCGQQDAAQVNEHWECRCTLASGSSARHQLPGLSEGCVRRLRANSC